MPFYLRLLVLPRHHPASLLGQSLTASSDAVSILFTARAIAPSCHLRTRRDVSSLVNVHTPPRYSAVLVLPPTSRFSVFASPPRWGSTKSLPCASHFTKSPKPSCTCDRTNGDLALQSRIRRALERATVTPTGAFDRVITFIDVLSSAMKQLITRIDDDLARNLKRQAERNGESVNSFVNRLLHIAVLGSGSPRQLWKAAALADGRLLARGSAAADDREFQMHVSSRPKEPGYAARAISEGRDEE